MKKDLAPWLLLPSVVLALGSVTLLAPRQAALAGPPPTQAVPHAPEGDGDGDELLEHWGDPQFSREEQTQMAGMAAGFLVLGAAAALRRARRKRRTQSVVLLRKTDISSAQRDTRKAA